MHNRRLSYHVVGACWSRRPSPPSYANPLSSFFSSASFFLVFRWSFPTKNDSLSSSDSARPTPLPFIMVEINWFELRIAARRLYYPTRSLSWFSICDLVELHYGYPVYRWLGSSSPPYRSFTSLALPDGRTKKVAAIHRRYKERGTSVKQLPLSYAIPSSPPAIVLPACQLFDGMLQRSHAGGVDWISALPDAVLQHVLGFLPADEAVRMSIVASRWRHLWSSLGRLRIVWPDRWINRVLLGRDPACALDEVEFVDEAAVTYVPTMQEQDYHRRYDGIP
ncbi:hypothetical protein HU200_016726 [Digitaria exilis]|uniref:F-box domain-containing protein n=1 Tax=Digitaria exilis TaxID=1010633 RepID=A0A835F7V5_9POAL|nr:hypothetical protein HU200_016726 [Digitaria exilis]